MKRLIGGVVLAALVFVAGPVRAEWVVVHGTAAQKINPDTFAGTCYSFLNEDIDDYSTGSKIIPNQNSTVKVIVPVPSPANMNLYLAKVKILFASDNGAKITRVEFFDGPIQYAGISNVDWYGAKQTRSIRPGGNWGYEKGLAVLIHVTGTATLFRSLNLYSVSAQFLPKP